MLNFLRKLRRPATAGKQEMKRGHYLKYALGEIILVVIGILIALSINNWNEGRKIDEDEKKLLEKVKTENEYNLNILTNDSTYFRNIQQTLYTLAVNLKKPQSDERDLLIGQGINEALRLVSLEFSKEYLTRYINNSQINDDEFTYEFIELKDMLGSVELGSQLISEYSFNNIIGWMESSIDFLEGEILDFEKLESEVFRNRLIVLSSLEESRSANIFRSIEKASRIDSLLTARLN